MSKWIAIFALCLALGSPAMAEEGARAPATLPAATADMGQVIFYRGGNLGGFIVGCGVRENGELISSLAVNKYFIVNLAPGIHEFSVSSEGRDSLRLEIEAGETYFVSCTMRRGIIVHRPNIAPSSQAGFELVRSNLRYVDSDDIGPHVLPDPGAAAPAVP